MLMFQQKRARLAVAVLEACGEIHVADRPRAVACASSRRRQVVAVDAAAGRAVEVEEAACRACRCCRSAPGSMPTARTALPPRGWRWKPWPIHSSDGPAAVEARGALDELRRHAGDALAPGRSAILEQRLELLEADRVGGEERPVEQPVAAHHVGERERERRVAAREGRQVQVGGAGGRRRARDRRRSSWRPASGSQWSCWWGADADGFAPQTRMQAASRALRGSKPSSEVP